jgi:peptide/nickel transport system substrate-binding protein
VSPKRNAILLLAALVACVCAEPADAYANRLTVALRTDIRGTEPGVNTDNDTDNVLANIVEGLVGYTENGQVAPLLADSINTSPDGLRYTFRLRHGVKFLNGAELTSTEVVWSIRRLLNPHTGWYCLSEFDGRKGFKIEDVTAVGRYTVLVSINKPSSVFLANLARLDCGMTAILHPDSVRNGKWVAPIGTGPFKLQKWQKGQSVTLQKADAYQSLTGPRDGYVGGKHAYVDGVEYLVVPDPDAVKAGLITGQIDAAEITTTDAKQLKSINSLQVNYYPTSSRQSVLFQTSDPLLSNVKLRMALAGAVDVAQILAIVADDKGRINGSVIDGRSPYYDSIQSKRIQYDPSAAKKLLKEAGYRGQPITIMVSNRKTSPSYNIAIVLQAMFRAIGVQARLEVLDFATQIERFFRGRYQITIWFTSPKSDPTLAFANFVGSKRVSPDREWDDPEVTALLDQSASSSDFKTRQATFDRMHNMMLKQVPILVLYDPVATWALSKRVDGFRPWDSREQVWGVRVKN